MRIKCKKHKGYQLRYLSGEEYLLITKTNYTPTLPHIFYCGLYSKSSENLNDVICIKFSRSNEICPIMSGYYFPKHFLNDNIDGVYTITENEYKLFKKCKTVKQINILLDNLYIVT